MVFRKSFPRRVEGINYPVWEEVVLSSEEEKNVELDNRKENLKIMHTCIKDTELLFDKLGYERKQRDIINVAIALFDKQSSHVAFKKEEYSQDKFNNTYDADL